jgi:hypothetical protein
LLCSVQPACTSQEFLCHRIQEKSPVVVQEKYISCCTVCWMHKGCQLTLAIASRIRRQQQTATSKHTKLYTRRNCPLRAVTLDSPITGKDELGVIHCASLWSSSHGLDPGFCCLGKISLAPASKFTNSRAGDFRSRARIKLQPQNKQQQARWILSSSTSLLPSMGATGPASCLPRPTRGSRLRTLSLLP